MITNSQSSKLFVKASGSVGMLLSFAVKRGEDYWEIGKTKARELLRGNNGFGVQIGDRWYANKRKLDIWIDNETM